MLRLDDQAIPRVPLRQRGLFLPIPLRLRLAAPRRLVAPVLQVVQCVIKRHRPDGAGLETDEDDGGAVTVIQRLGSAANLDIHLHGLVLEGVCLCGADDVPTFVDIGAPTDDELRALLQAVITRLTRLLTRRTVLVEDMGRTAQT